MNLEPINRKKRILISGGLSAGGPETHISMLCNLLVRANVEVTVAASATNWSRSTIVALRKQRVRVIVPPFGYGRFAFIGKLCCFAIWPLLLRRRFDAVYCIGEGWMHSWAIRFCRADGWSIYHEIAHCPTLNSVAHQVGLKMNALIGNSIRVTEGLRELFPLKPAKCIAFLTSDGPVAFQPKKKPLERTLNVAYLGRIVTHKRPKELIQNWARFQSKSFLGPSKLHFHGGDYGTGLINEMQKQIGTLKLGDLVRIHGEYNVRDLPSILKDIDLVVLPSEYEGLPLVLMEAMVRGIPIVATSAGGTDELAIDNPDAVVTPGTSWEEFVLGVSKIGYKIRNGEIDFRRLHQWTEARYGYKATSEKWVKALCHPKVFFEGFSESAA